MSDFAKGAVTDLVSRLGWCAGETPLDWVWLPMNQCRQTKVLALDIPLNPEVSGELNNTTEKSFRFVTHDGVIEGEGLFFT